MLSKLPHNWGDGRPAASHSTASVRKALVHILFVYLRNNRHCCALVYPIKLYLNTTGNKERESLGFLWDPWERMFLPFKLGRVHLSVTIKWPWLGSFQLSRFTLLHETQGNISRICWGTGEGLDKLLQRYNQRQKEEWEKKAWQRQIWYCPHAKPSHLTCFCLYKLKELSWWFLSLGISLC